MRRDPFISIDRGLTALELLVTLAVVCVVAGLGVPAMRDFSLNAQRAAAVNGLLAAIHFARGAALTRDATIVLCKTADARACAGTTTGGGLRWIVGIAADSSAASGAALPAGPVEVLRDFQLEFTGRIVSNRAAFEFRPFPLRSTNGTISVCDARGGRSQRAIVVSYSGRPRLAAPTTDSSLPACGGD